MQFGDRLRQERLRRNLSQEALAEAIGVSPKSISRWEKGQAVPQGATRQLLSSFFDLPSQALFQTPEGQMSYPLLWRVPYPRNPFFTGRAEILSHLRERLRQEHTLALTQSLAISGLGGIGKSQVALEYAYHSQQDYPYIFWSSAATQESLLADVIAIADLLQLPERNDQEHKKVLQAVKRWFATHQGWLWILDNADDLTIVQEALPTSCPGHILLTTRAQALGTLAERIEIETMGMVEGTLFLLRRAKLLAPDAFLDQVCEDHLSAAEALVLEMDGLPLALDQAGAYIEEVGCSLKAYLTLYQSHRKELLERRGRLCSDHPKSVATTWSLNFEKVEQANPAAADLLRLCAFLEPDAIPEELISEGNRHLGPLLGPVVLDTFKLNEAIGELRRFSLVQSHPQTRRLRIHRLVQAVLKDAMGADLQRQWAQRVVQVVNTAFPQQVEITTWSRCRHYLGQVQACSVLIEDYELMFEEAASLLSRTVNYLHAYGLHQQAEPLEQRALRIREHVLGPDHPDVATSLCQLGLLSYEQGKYKQAEPLLRRALHIQEQALGPDHLDLVASLKNLAFIYINQEQYDQAEPLLRRALHIREQALGPDHPDTSSALTNLAFIYYEQGKYEQAEPLDQRALHIREQALGPDHPGLAIPLNNLGITYYEQGKYEQAEPLLRRACRILECTLEPDDTLIAHPLTALANLYRAQGKYEQAEPLYQRALSLRQRVRPQQLDTAETLHDLAVFREAQGRNQEAASLYQQALVIRENHLGAAHRKTNKTRERLRVVLRARGNAGTAG